MKCKDSKNFQIKPIKMELNKIHHADCLEGLRQLPDNHVGCCIWAAERSP